MTPGGSDPLAAPGPVAAGAVLHASAVAVAGRGLLILGPSGAGKSALALQMIALGADLVADDATRIEAGPTLACPGSIAGRIEARGLGLLRLPAAGPVPARCALRLDPQAATRLPDRMEIVLCGVPVPLYVARPAPHLAAALVLALCHDTLPDDIHP